jgi:hypothetical protein
MEWPHRSNPGALPGDPADPTAGLRIAERWTGARTDTGRAGLAARFAPNRAGLPGGPAAT